MLPSPQESRVWGCCIAWTFPALPRANLKPWTSPLLIYFCINFMFFGLWIISGRLVTYAPYKTESPAFLAGCEAYVRHIITACVFVCLCAGGCGSGRGPWAVL